MKPLRSIAATCLLGAALAPGVAQAWWNDDWAFRKELTLDTSATGAGITAPASDVPVLLRLSLANFGYFGDTLPDGSDLRFIAGDDQTPLKFHIERYDPQTQLAFLWVRLPQLAAGVADSKFYLYYGNTEAPAAGDAAGSYDANQALVYHFGPDRGAPQDSTGYGAQPVSFSAEVKPASLIGAGASFEGTTSVQVPAGGALRHVPAQGYTASTWLRIENPQSRAYVLALEDAAGAIVLGVDGLRPFLSAGATDALVSIDSSVELVPGNWHHLALRVASGSAALFVDGINVGSGAVSVPEVAGTLTLGGGSADANFLVGELDEVQVSNVGRSDAWLAAAARSQGMVAPLLRYGGDVQKEGGGEPSYFATTLRNVTVDGWVIIVILALMFLVSVAVMIAKAVLLAKVARDNAKFLAEFRKMRDDPAAIERRVGSSTTDEEDSAFEEGADSQLMSALYGDKGAFGSSTLYRLYHHGMRETLSRIEGRAVSSDRVNRLSSAAIASIRATMDASMTRMTQRLNSSMVLLTIAISGGPFLGLLGTVIGVMITFAAIALSGDVNINAIAPGTAAALMATVAGLAVAIPCLFGYNWLNVRIKEISADMRVFVDEFVTRIAETYT